MADGSAGRSDVSRFLVHLTRNYGNDSARRNLLSILARKRIEARSPHCLFKHLISSKMRFSEKLQGLFNTVCLTEAPLDQIQHLAQEIPRRQVHLRPFGLVFLKGELRQRGANPALYISDKTLGLREFLLEQFREHFRDHRTFKSLRKEHGKRKAEAIITYHALVNLISDKHDFSWEREWRFRGDLTFTYENVSAPDNLERSLRKIPASKLADVDELLKLPIISPDWSYEQVVEELSYRIRDTD